VRLVSPARGTGSWGGPLGELGGRARRAGNASRCLVTDSTYALWQRLASFGAAGSERALRELMDWLARELDADNVIWIGAVRALRGAAATDDPFFGWRLRARESFKPDSDSYKHLLKDYYDGHHYGKLTPTYYARSHAGKLDHVGMTGRASLAGAGRFRVHRLRDGWIDFAAFRRTLHYRLYYRDQGIVDRMTIGFPVSEDAESFLLVDREKRQLSERRRPFNARDAALAGAAVRGVPELHRRLFLDYGLLVSDKPLGPMERRILHGLLSGGSEKELAAAAGQSHGTLHKYVSALYKRFQVNGRAGLMALWLGPGAQRKPSIWRSTRPPAALAESRAVLSGPEGLRDRA
jgi:DNA-binding CsgD family transcriptional regulator